MRAERRNITLTAAAAGLAGLAAALAGLACGDPDPEPQIQLLRSLQPEIREKAAGKLLLYGDRVVPRLIQETESSYTRVRFEVARLLGRLRDPRAADALIRLLDDSSFNVASYAAWGLGELKAKKALPSLLRFTETPAKTFRQQIVQALGPCYDDTLHAALDDSVRRVIERAFHDPVPGVRIAALGSARHLGYAGMVEALIRLAADHEAKVRHVAVQTLGQAAIGRAPRSSGPAPAAERAAIEQALVLCLEDSYQSIRTKAVRALEQMGPPPGAAPALRRLAEGGTVEDRREAGRVLEAIAAGAAAPAGTQVPG